MKHSLFYIVFLTIVSCSLSKNIKENALLYYGKTPCLGECPVFDMYIYNDGKVIYNGFQNVVLKGEHKFSISKNHINEIKKELKNIDFKIKTNIVRDLPNLILKYNGEKPTVNNKEEIKDLVKLLEKIIN